jgi:hypothetical protein
LEAGPRRASTPKTDGGVIHEGRRWCDQRRRTSARSTNMGARLTTDDGAIYEDREKDATSVTMKIEKRKSIHASLLR